MSLSLDSDPKLIPKSANIPAFNMPRRASLAHNRHAASTTLRDVEEEPPTEGEQTPTSEPISSHPDSPPDGDGLSDDPDDFVIMTEKQAQRIVNLCEMSFGVEISKDVVVAEANVGALARRVLGARSLRGKDP